MTKEPSDYVLLKSAKSLLQLNGLGGLQAALQKTHEAAETIMATPEFKRLADETEQYRGWLEQEWAENKFRVTEALSEITGLEMDNLEATVFVTHPRLHNGTNIPDKNIICWGNEEEWKNYSLVYICHELLHILTHKKAKDYEVMHALIELATDNELRIRLNNGMGEYFYEEKYDVGHPELRDLEKELLPVWRQFLKGELPYKNIIELEHSCSAK